MSEQGHIQAASKTNNDESEFGRLVVERRLATADELQACLESLRKLRKEQQEASLSDLLVERGFITASQRNRLLSQLDENRPGQQIPGFEMIRKLGRGAMATVFLARQLSLDRYVAIKVLPRRFSENPDFVERFYREGRAAAKLNHRNIVQAFDVGEAGGYHYFVMEYVDGKTVYDDLAEDKAYSEQDALDIAIQVAEALSHAHKKGLIHRDVKPKNIMITNDGAVKLADMGLAREASDTQIALAEAGRAYGTPYYIAPEQIRGEVSIDFRADIYSLGATFYHMVTGQVPFNGPSPSAVMHKHLREPLVPPDHINQSLSVGTGEIIEVMMAKDRDDRYANTDDLLVDLRAVQKGNPPVQARSKFNPRLLKDLAEGEADEAEISYKASRRPQPGGQMGIDKMVLAMVIMGILLGLSVLMNVLQLLLR